ncbi:MAG: hypothetical protein HY472_00345 [Candidatus Sungbacteria bacterium]|nr:hypothetical protein [Candidatus Sungbacteria bacterium]
MTQGKRRILFYSLVMLFVIVSPILISVSFGYTVNFAERRIEETGGVFIKSVLPRLTVRVDGAIVKETSLISGNALITGVEPGARTVTIEKSGSVPWSRRVTIEPGIVTDFRTVLLVPEHPVIATSTPEEQARVSALRKKAGTPEAPLPAAASSALFIRDKAGRLIDRTGTTTRIVAGRVNSFFPAPSGVFFVDENGFLAHYDARSTGITTLGRPGFYLSKKPVRFMLSASGELALIDPSGGLFLLNDEEELRPISADVRDAIFDASGQKLLIVKERSLEILWRDANQYQPFQKKGAREDVLAFPSPILSADWFYGDNAHVAIRTSGGAILTDIDARGGRYRAKLIQGKTDDFFTIPEIPRTIFFTKNKTLLKIEL